MLDIKFFLKFSSCSVVVNIRNFYSLNKFGIFRLSVPNFLVIGMPLLSLLLYFF